MVPRFREYEVKKLCSSACCRQENASFSPHIHRTWGPPFSPSLYTTESSEGRMKGRFHDPEGALRHKTSLSHKKLKASKYVQHLRSCNPLIDNPCISCISTCVMRGGAFHLSTQDMRTLVRTRRSGRTETRVVPSCPLRSVVNALIHHIGELLLDRTIHSAFHIRCAF